MITVSKVYWRMLEGARLLAVLAVLSIGLASALEALALLMLLPILGESGGGGAAAPMLSWWHPPSIAYALIAFSCVGVASVLFKFLSDAFVLLARNRVELNAGANMAMAMLDVAWEPYISLRQGDIAKTLLLEGNQIAFGVRQFLIGIGMVLTILPLLLSAALISVSMTAYTLLFGGVAATMFFAASRPVRHHVNRVSETMDALSVRIAETFGNLKFLRSTGMVQASRLSVVRTFREYMQRYFYSQALPSLLRHGVEMAAVIFIAIFLFWQLSIESQSVAAVLVFLAIFYRLVPRAVAAQECLFQAATHLPWFESWDRRYSFCCEHRKQTDGKTPPDFSRGILLDQVSFSYARSVPVLASISFFISPGKCLGLVGASGAGKTTILDLISGLLCPTSGNMSLGGVSPDRLDIDAWQKRIGFVPQDSPVFFGTVLDNIAYGEAAPDRAFAEACARQAYAWEFIERMPDGMDTILGERGSSISGGQRQRLGIARALYRKPWLLILDEATSALDSVSEQAIQRALTELKGQMAILLVTHRLQTVAMADEILVLDCGCIVESGSWGDLVAKKQRFYELANGRRDE